MDHLPDTVNLLVDLALAVLRTATGTVHQAFGTASNRTQAPGQVQDTVAATGTLFSPEALLWGTTEEAGIDPGVDHG